MKIKMKEIVSEWRGGKNEKFKNMEIVSEL